MLREVEASECRDGGIFIRIRNKSPSHASDLSTTLENYTRVRINIKMCLNLYPSDILPNTQTLFF